MSVVVKFFELLLLAIGLLLPLFPVTFVVIANLAAAFAYSRSRGKDPLSPFTFLPILWSLLIIAVGAIFAYHGKPEAAPSWPENVIWVLILFQLVHCIWLTVKNANNRWMTIALCLLFLLFGFTCTLMSGTSLTNQWE